MKSEFQQQADRLKKPVKRSTSKRKRHAAKVANIKTVRDEVMERDGEMCRVVRLLIQFGVLPGSYIVSVPPLLELAHIDARGMGGNPDLSRDTAENTIMAAHQFHRGTRSLHSGHLKVRALTNRGMNGPVCFEFYEKLPSELT